MSLSLEKVTGVTNMGWGEIAANAVVDGAISLGLNYIPGVEGITKCRNSMSAAYKSGLKKPSHHTVAKMAAKTIAKGLASNFVSGLPMDAYYGLKQSNTSKRARLVHCCSY